MRSHLWLRPRNLAVVFSILAFVGCGSNEPASTTKKPAAPAAKAITINVTAPQDNDVVRRNSVAVRGTVDPPDADVQVAGKPATVSDGIFSARITLDPGDNTVDVIATAEGAKPTTTSLTVTRGKTEAALAAAAQRRRARERAAEKRAANARAAKRDAAAAPVSVPDETGERLDVAEDDLRANGLSYREVGGGTFGIVVKSNWIVCETRPAAGASVKRRTRIALIVDRDC